MENEQQPEMDRPQQKTEAPTHSRVPAIKGRWLWAVIAIAVAAAGVTAAAGYYLGRRQAAPPSAAPVSEAAGGQAAQATTWTCSMHPQIKLPKPGKCPICFMDLIPLTADAGDDDNPRRLRMSSAAMALASIRTAPAERKWVSNIVRMVGKVDYDETRLVDSTAWVPGRLDRLYVDYTGVMVRKGDHLFHIYSPELVVAQDELLLNWRAYQQSTDRTRQQALNNVKISEDKLRLWGLVDEQIEEIKQRGKASDHVTIYAPAGGIVVKKHCNEGAYVKEGTPVYTIADLSLVWVYLDAYESDLAWLRYGQEIEFTTESYPGKIFHGRIAFIDPVLNEKTRTVKVRVNVPNKDFVLKPGMFVRATVHSRLAAGGRVLDPSLAGKWICPMHPEVVKDASAASDGKPPTCDICGMDMVRAEELGFIAAETAQEPPLVIPATAPLITGKRAVVYVKVPNTEKPTFEGREVVLGQRAGAYYLVRAGLREGENVVTEGNFKIDSALQIKAGPSMMNPQDEISSPQKKPNVPPSFRVALGPLYQSYLGAVKALAQDDLAAARASVQAIPQAADTAEAKNDLLDEDARKCWDGLRTRIVLAAHELLDERDLGPARNHFHELSEAMIALVQGFGHALADPIYQVHCPMAFEGRGADWLQQAADTANPYFGHEMPRCGDRVATFESQAPLEVPAVFRQQLAGLYGAYLKLQASLADDRPADAVSAWTAMRQALATVRPEGLEGRALDAWQVARAGLQQSLAAEPEATAIDEIRKHFEAVAGTMLAIVEAFGHPQPTALYKAFCPMAFDNKGAAWLQAGDKIANPYFGHKMLHCGEIQRTFAVAEASVANQGPVKEGQR